MTRSIPGTSPATEADLEALRDQLGRLPRGVVGIAARCACGRPTVVATAPRLEDSSPFPTTFYLTHPRAVKACSTLEAERLMDEYNRALREDQALAQAYARAHEDYLAGPVVARALLLLTAWLDPGRAYDRIVRRDSCSCH